MARNADAAPSEAGIGDPLRPGRRLIRRALAGGVAVVALSAFGAFLVYTYNKGQESAADAAPVVLKPKLSAYKVRPEVAGGMTVPDRDKEVYEIIAAAPAKPTVERLMPGREEPLAPPKQEAVFRVAPPTGAPAAPSEKALAMAVPEADSGKPVTAANRPAAAPSPGKPLPPSPAPAAPQKEAGKAPAGGAVYWVQLASLRSRPAVNKAWKELVRKRPDLLSRLDMSVQRADLGPAKGIYFRMQAGPFGDRASARRLCSKLTGRKAGCLVVRR